MGEEAARRTATFRRSLVEVAEELRLIRIEMQRLTEAEERNRLFLVALVETGALSTEQLIEVAMKVVRGQEPATTVNIGRPPRQL